ncbi:MAG: biotin/lipoyl-containing protein [Balneolaceae bacterium]
MKQFKTEYSDKSHTINIDFENGKATLDGREVSFQIESENNDRILLRLGTKLYNIANSMVDGDQVTFSLNGKSVETSVKDEQQILLEKLGFSSQSVASEGIVKAPMPGKILEILVREGDEIQSGEPLLVLEAMKMENELKSVISGVVSLLHVHEGDNVEKNQTLLDIKPRG